MPNQDDTEQPIDENEQIAQASQLLDETARLANPSSTVDSFVNAYADWLNGSSAFVTFATGSRTGTNRPELEQVPYNHENANVEVSTPTQATEAEPVEDVSEDELEPAFRCEVCEQEEDACRCDVCGVCDVQYDPETSECRCLTCIRCEVRYDQVHGSCRCVDCEGCGEMYDPEQGRECDCTYCANCDSYSSNAGECDNCGHDPEDNPERGVREYNERAENLLDFFPEQHTVKPNFLYLGVELETECKRDYKQSEAVSDIQDTGYLDRWVIAKHDGSLTRGIEVVTAPSDLKTHQEKWPAVLKAMRKSTESWKKTSTGMHVHLSRAFFSSYEIAKFVLFVNSEENRPWIVGLAGRTSPDYAALERKCGATVLDRGERYASVNLKPARTIEVRIFKGTLNDDHVLANIEFCHALAQWVKVNSLSDCDKWVEFMKFVSQKCYAKRYAHLITYVTKIEPKIEEKMKQLAKNAITRGNHFWENLDQDHIEPLLEAVNQ